MEVSILFFVIPALYGRFVKIIAIHRFAPEVLACEIIVLECGAMQDLSLARGLLA